MCRADNPQEQPERLFLRRSSAAGGGTLWLLGGLAMFGVAAVGFALSLAGQGNQFSLHAMTTLPTLMGLGAIGIAWSLAHTPSQVAVGPQGIRIEGRRGSQSFTWDQIGWSTIATLALSQRRQLVIFDTEGKTVAKLSEAFDGFDTMVELVKQRIAEKGGDASERIQLAKAKRSALLIASFSAVLLVVAGLNVWMAYRQQRATRLLDQAAVPGEAEIVRRFLAPNGVTPRLEYRVTTPEGLSGTRNAEVARPYWDSLEGVTIVPVVYVPEEPAISRLETGEVEEDDWSTSPPVMYVLSSVIAGLCMLFFAAAALQWRGWDIDLDSKTGKLSIKRFGTGT